MTIDSFNAFINKWVTPATVVIVFGAIVWGVQLNIVTLENSKNTAANARAIQILDERITSNAFDLQRTAILLEQATANLNELKNAAAAHNAEAEEWKRRIIRNQDAREHIERNHRN